MSIEKFHATGEFTPGGFHILEMDSGQFKGVQWSYGEMKFGEEENPDGTVTLSFDYDIANKNTVERILDKEEGLAFGQQIGAILHHILEEQMKTGEVQYHGGTDDPAS